MAQKRWNLLLVITACQCANKYINQLKGERVMGLIKAGLGAVGGVLADQMIFLKKILIT